MKSTGVVNQTLRGLRSGPRGIWPPWTLKLTAPYRAVVERRRLFERAQKHYGDKIAYSLKGVEERAVDSAELIKLADTRFLEICENRKSFDGVSWRNGYIQGWIERATPDPLPMREPDYSAELRAAVLSAPDCHDHSCCYAISRSGMRTNGGCRCARQDIEMWAARIRAVLRAEPQEKGESE